MTASIGVVELIWATAVAANSRPMVTPTPTTALRSGSPAATNEPNVSTSTTSATRRPSASVTVSVGNSVLKSCPPSAACAPSGRAAARSSTTSPSASFVASVTSLWPSSSWTVMRVATSSSLTDAGMVSS